MLYRVHCDAAGVVSMRMNSQSRPFIGVARSTIHTEYPSFYMPNMLDKALGQSL